MLTLSNPQAPAFKGFMMYNASPENDTKDMKYEETTFEQDMEMLNAIKSKLEKDTVSIKNEDPVVQLQFTDLKALVTPGEVHFRKGDSLNLTGEISSEALNNPTESQKNAIDTLIFSIRELALKQPANHNPLIKGEETKNFPDLKSALDNILQTIKAAIVED